MEMHGERHIAPQPVLSLRLEPVQPHQRAAISRQLQLTPMHKAEPGKVAIVRRVESLTGDHFFQAGFYD